MFSSTFPNFKFASTACEGLRCPRRHRRGRQISSTRSRDVDGRRGSGYLDAEELGVLFKNMRMPMGQRELDDIVDEIDVDGNGEIDFEEFLLVIKNMQNPGAVQSKLGVAVQKGVKKGVFQTTMRGGAKALFEGVAGAAKEILELAAELEARRRRQPTRKAPRKLKKLTRTS